MLDFAKRLASHAVAGTCNHRRFKLRSREKRKLKKFFVHLRIYSWKRHTCVVWVQIRLRAEPRRIWTLYKGLYGERNTFDFISTLNIPKYEHFTREINKTSSFLVCPLWSLMTSSFLDFRCHHWTLFPSFSLKFYWRQRDPLKLTAKRFPKE